jgi:hypothetical protein
MAAAGWWTLKLNAGGGQELPPEVTPLVAVVNSKSGGRQGKNLLKLLRGVFNPAQVS